MSEFAVVKKGTNKIVGAYFCSQDIDDEKNTPEGCYRIPLAPNHPLRCGVASFDDYVVDSDNKIVKKDQAQ